MDRTELRQTARGQERDRNERKTSNQTDSRSVKQTERRTGARAEETGRKRRQSPEQIKLPLSSTVMLGTSQSTFKASSRFGLCIFDKLQM